MIKIERTSVMNWENAIRGARNPMNSWEKSDSHWGCISKGGEFCAGDCGTWCTGYQYKLGPNDLSLMMRLRNAGPDERKFMRQIFVSVDITAPLYWWKEFDTYKVGTVANSCSTMHKIHAKPFDIDDFSNEHLFDFCPNFDMDGVGVLWDIVKYLNYCRKKYLETKDKEYWWQMIQLLPASYNQMRTVTLNYEVLANIYKSRKDHKLDEWRELCAWVLTLPYPQIITGEQ